jgi:hypothetical protein
MFKELRYVEIGPFFHFCYINFVLTYGFIRLGLFLVDELMIMSSAGLGPESDNKLCE